MVQLAGLRAGEETAAGNLAWEVAESNAWTDPDFLRTYENNGAAVRIPEGGRGATDVQVIPYQAN